MTFLAIALKPLAALIMFGLICLPIRLAVQKWFPESRIKRLLLRPVIKQRPDGSGW